MTSTSIGAAIFALVSPYLGSYRKKDKSVIPAFWYYGLEAFDGAPLSENPPSEWKAEGLEVIVSGLPDLQVESYHGTTLLEATFLVTVIPHGNDLGNISETVERIAQKLQAESIALIPRNERLGISTQYQIRVRK